jgi:hypothetical protein
MRHICGALVLAQMMIAASVEARAEITCSSQAAGVSGVISDRKDMIASVNCIGQQLAELRNAAVAADKVEAARIEELARQIAMLQSAVDGLSRRLGALERNVVDIQSPLATRPW